MSKKETKDITFSSLIFLFVWWILHVVTGALLLWFATWIVTDQEVVLGFWESLMIVLVARFVVMRLGSI